MVEVGHATALAIGTVIGPVIGPVIGTAIGTVIGPVIGAAITVVLAAASQDQRPAAKDTDRPSSERVPTASGIAPLVPPPARAPIAGLRGFETRSRIEYPSQPGRLHDLRAAYVFPDRVRWWIAARDGVVEQRRLRYQYGKHVLAVEPQQAASVEFRDEDRAAILAAFELRRALFLWPDDRKWTGTGDTRTSSLANGDEMRAQVAGTPPRPTQLEYVPAARDVRDSLRAVTWSNAAPRAWPATFEVWNGETFAWRESVDAVDVETRFVDSFFVPPDRRGVIGSPVEGVRDLDIPPVCLRRIELPADTTWDAACAERDRLEAESKAQGLPELEDWVTFELRSDASPAAVLLRLARVPDSAPAGFALLPDRIGTATSVRGLEAVKPEVVKRLSARLPAGVQAGQAYARFDRRRPDGDVVLVLPVD